MSVPYAFVSFCDQQPAGGRWDQAQITRMLNGDEWVVPGGVEFVEVPQTELYVSKVGIAIMPVGHYVEHGEVAKAMKQLSNWLSHFRWIIIIATSDECSLFPWEQVQLPKNARLWVMNPRPDRRYPPGTRFIGCGSPVSAKEIYDQAALTRDLDLFYSGQVNHERRQEMMRVAQSMDDGARRVKVHDTGGFTKGFPQEQYLFHTTRAWFVPCPSGPCTQDSFRFFEALEAGAFPIADELRPDGEGLGYWRMIFGDLWDEIGVDLRSWEDLPSLVEALSRGRARHTASVTAAWAAYKRRLAWDLESDVRDVGGPFVTRTDPDDAITVIIPTSPVPSNPSLDMIQETIESVRDRLPRAEILIGCDGVRSEQQHRAEAYGVFLKDLTFWANAQQNIQPFIFDHHWHQSGMMHRILPFVRTPYVLFVEQDTPLEGEIPFGFCLDMMEDEELALLRFSHEAGVLPGHEHLFLETEPGLKPYVRTIQFSARPHLARTEWYRDKISTYWSPTSTTFIEDVLHGVIQAGVTIIDGEDRAFTDGKQVLRAWQRNRLAVYAPEGTWKRSGHLDGRGSDPKYTQHYRFVGPRPPGAPGEGEL